MEQMQDLSQILNCLTVTGLNNNRLIASAAQIIDSSIEVIDDEKEEGENK